MCTGPLGVQVQVGEERERDEQLESEWPSTDVAEVAREAEAVADPLLSDQLAAERCMRASVNHLLKANSDSGAGNEEEEGSDTHARLRLREYTQFAILFNVFCAHVIFIGRQSVSLVRGTQFCIREFRIAQVLPAFYLQVMPASTNWHFPTNEDPRKMKCVYWWYRNQSRNG